MERLSWAEEEGARRQEELAGWFEQGEEIVGLLAATMHGEIDPRTVDERPIREWQATGRDLLRHQHENLARFGRAIRRSGLSEEEVALAIGRAMSERGMTAQDAIEALERGDLRP